MSRHKKRKSSPISIKSSQPISSSERLLIEKSYRQNRIFFGFQLPRLKIIVCHSDLEWKQESRYYYFKFALGLVLRNGTVVVKSHRFANKNYQTWQKILTHEINHSFWITLVAPGPNLWNPVWFSEALACHLAQNDLLIPLAKLRKQPSQVKKYLNLPYRYRGTLFPDSGSLRYQYSLWQHFLAWLIKKDSELFSKLLSQLRRLSTEPKFNRYFSQLWGKAPQQLYRQFVNECVLMQ